MSRLRRRHGTFPVHSRRPGTGALCVTCHGGANPAADLSWEGDASQIYNTIVETAEGEPSFLLYVDFRSAVSWVMDLARTVQPGMPMPPIADGPAVPFFVTASSDGRKHVMNLHVDVAGIAGLFPQPPR